jgi:AcrR family transcriptional regulator
MSTLFASEADVRNAGEVTMTRRERVRLATIAEIKRAAWEQIATDGAGALSIRGVARAIGMSPAGLYRYYDGLDALLTELIADAYNDLADAVVAATTAPGSVRDRLRAGILAYRQWSLEHPSQFLLVFGTPIPGYAAPQEGPTVQANRRIGAAFFEVVAEGLRAGALDLPVPARPTVALDSSFLTAVDPQVPAAWIQPFVSAWAHFHGMVTLELLGQLDWAYPDGEAFYRGEIDRLLDSWTVTPSTSAAPLTTAAPDLSAISVAD